jgi:hypothetical protein
MENSKIRVHCGGKMPKADVASALNSKVIVSIKEGP